MLRFCPETGRVLPGGLGVFDAMWKKPFPNLLAGVVAKTSA